MHLVLLFLKVVVLLLADLASLLLLQTLRLPPFGPPVLEPYLEILYLVWNHTLQYYRLFWIMPLNIIAGFGTIL